MRISAVVIIAVTLLVISGCGRAPVPGENVGTVTTFSLGSADFTPFKTRPTVRQLYDTASHLYGSFDSLALSEELVSRGVFDPHNNGTETRVTTAGAHAEVRWVRPHKEVDVTTIRGRKGVAVVNDLESLYYRPWNNTYCRTLSLFARGASQHLGLIEESNLELLPDARIGGAAVYVLRMRIERDYGKAGGMHKFANIVYLGKDDLLPRKIVQTVQWPPANNGQPHPPSVTTTTFHGINANVSLPETMFSTEPPGDAKPY